MKSLFKFITIGLFILCFQSLFAQTQKINNGAMRFGAGAIGSVLAGGNLDQPFYYSTLNPQECVEIKPSKHC